MKIMYCWRCGLDVAMLDENEFPLVENLYAQAVRDIKETARFQPPEIKEEFIQALKF